MAVLILVILLMNSAAGGLFANKLTLRTYFDNAAESLAARFAAKEAGAKALGTGISHGVSWLEIEVIREPGGRPTIRFHGRAGELAGRMGVAQIALSITHTDTLSMASVVLEKLP